jgi:hypothetical protein
MNNGSPDSIVKAANFLVFVTMANTNELIAAFYTNCRIPFCPGLSVVSISIAPRPENAKARLAFSAERAIQFYPQFLLMASLPCPKAGFL